MLATFNLIDNPWIPCLEADGRQRELGLYEVLARAHEIRAVEGASALETAALHRFLLAVLQRAYPVTDKDAWWSLWQAGRWDEARLQRYLNEWQHRFDLFDPKRPFYQCPEEEIAPRSLVFLFPGLSAAAHYNHAVATDDLALPPAAAARLLLVAQTFSLAGIAHPQKRLFFTAAPWSAGMAFAGEGQSLFQTTALNLLRYTPTHPMQQLAGGSDDHAAWEMDDPFQPAREVPLGYVDYLTWQNRRLRLLPEEVEGKTVVRRASSSPGLKLSPGLLDPMKHYRQDPDRGWRPLLLDERRALWRDSTLLLSLRDGRVRPPLALSWLAELAEEYDLAPSARYRLAGYGFLADQAKGLLYRAERLPLRLAYLKAENEYLLAALSQAIDASTGAHQCLRRSLRQMATLILSRSADHSGGRQPEGKDVSALVEHWGVERGYWSDLEVPFLRLVDELPEREVDGALNDWYGVVRNSAFAALDRAAELVGTTAPALKAAAQGRRQLAVSMAGAGLVHHAS